MKRFVGLALAVALVATLAWSTSAQQKSLAGTTLVVGLRSLPETDFIMARAKDFENTTGIKLNFVLFPELELREKLILDATTKAGGYQVIAIDGGYIPEFVEAGWIVPMGTYLKPEWNVSDILSKYRGFLSYKGQLYALPIYGEATQLMYRRDWFEQAGVKPPTTMEELTALAKRFTQPPTRYGLAMRGRRGDGMNIYIWTEWLRSYGGQFWTPDFKPVFNSPQGVRATEEYARLLRTYGPPGSATYTWDDVQTAFMAGRVAMIIDATNFFTRIEDPAKSRIAGKIGYAMVPQGPAGRFPGIYALGFGISYGAKTEQQRAAAALFIQWATSQKMEQDKAAAGIVSVSRRSVFESAAFKAKYGRYHGWLESTVQAISTADPEYRPRIVEWRDIGNRLGISVEEVIAGIKPAPQALNEAADYAAGVFAKTRQGK
jgi:multiple sugar transport system substrate-binding protein